jgi:branched-chain amino acid transport system permease protein
MLIQILANGIIYGCAYALVALGFALIYNTTRIFHFAHGAVYTLSAYLFFTVYRQLGYSFILAALFTIVVSALIGILVDQFIYRPLDKRGSSLLIHMLSSLGLYVVIINLIAMIYGNNTKELTLAVQPIYTLGPVRLTQLQIVIAISFVTAFVIVIIILRRTSLGMTLRAMRDDPLLVSVIGINPQHVRIIVFALGSALAAISAILTGADTGIDPYIGMTMVLTGAVAVIVGGIGIFEGAAFGGLLLGILHSFIALKFSTRWQEAVTFLVLIVFLLFRPEGVFAQRRRLEEKSA